MTVTWKRGLTRQNFFHEKLSLLPNLSYTITKKPKWEFWRSMRVLKLLKALRDEIVFRILSDKVLFRVLSDTVPFNALSVRVIFSILNDRVLFMVLSDRVIIDRSGPQSCFLFPICTFFNLLKVDALFYIFRKTFRLIN